MNCDSDHLMAVGLVGGINMERKCTILSHYITTMGNKMVWSLSRATNSVNRTFELRY